MHALLFLAETKKKKKVLLILITNIVITVDMFFWLTSLLNTYKEIKHSQGK